MVDISDTLQQRFGMDDWRSTRSGAFTVDIVSLSTHIVYTGKKNLALSKCSSVVFQFYVNVNKLECLNKLPEGETAAVWLVPGGFK